MRILKTTNPSTTPYGGPDPVHTMLYNTLGYILPCMDNGVAVSYSLMLAPQLHHSYAFLDGITKQGTQAYSLARFASMIDLQLECQRPANVH